MKFRDWLQQWLGISDLSSQVSELERRIGAIEDHVTGTLQHFGQYNGRTDEELSLMKRQLETLLDTVSNVIDSIENQESRDRAVMLRRRLKNNLTRVNNARNSRLA